jgi:hypothetical protein
MRSAVLLVSFGLLGCSRPASPEPSDRTAEADDGPPLACPADHTLERSDHAQTCVDALGRYDGPARDREVRDGHTVIITGQYRNEAPDGRWVCTKEPGGERIELDFDAAAWAKTVWGIDIERVQSIGRRRHLGVLPRAFCPQGDWATVAAKGWTSPELGELSKHGVTVHAHHR